MPDVDRCFGVVYKNKEGGNTGSLSIEHINLEDCKEKCLENDDCQSISSFLIGFVITCKLYKVKTPETELANEPDAVHLEKNCPTGMS